MPSLQSAISEPDIATRLVEIVSAGHGLSMRVEPSALNRLEQWALERHGWETCGIIFGSFESDGTVANVTGFVSSGTRGSSESLDELRERPASRHGQAIGFFRNELRNGFSVREEDCIVLRHLFPGEDCCFLTIRAGPKMIGKLEVYHARAQSHPVLLKRLPIGGVRTETYSIDHGFKVPFTRPAAKTPSPEPPEDLTAPPTQKPISWATGGALAAISIAALAFTLGRQSAPDPKPKPTTKSKATVAEPSRTNIDLKVVPRGPELEIRWNPALPAISTAVRGMLIVTDGAAGDIGLDLTQMRSGMYVYKPVIKTVHILLMIYQSDGSFVGAMQEFTGKSTLPNGRPVEPRPESAVLPPPSIIPPPAAFQPEHVTRTVAAKSRAKPVRKHRKRSRRANATSVKSATLP